MSRLSNLIETEVASEFTRCNCEVYPPEINRRFEFEQRDVDYYYCLLTTGRILTNFGAIEEIIFYQLLMFETPPFRYVCIT